MFYYFGTSVSLAGQPSSVTRRPRLHQQRYSRRFTFAEDSASLKDLELLSRTSRPICAGYSCLLRPGWSTKPLTPCIVSRPRTQYGVQGSAPLNPLPGFQNLAIEWKGTALKG